MSYCNYLLVVRNYADFGSRRQYCHSRKVTGHVSGRRRPRRHHDNHFRPPRFYRYCSKVSGVTRVNKNDEAPLTHWQRRIVRTGGIVIGLGGLLLLAIGLGTALDQMVAHSHPVGAIEALLVRSEHTLAGVLFMITGFGFALKVSDSNARTD